MNAMLLAAGLGMRLRPITETMPKCLVKAGGRSLLERGLDMLAAAGVQRTVVNVHYLAEMLTDYIAHIRPDYRMEIVISDEREKLLDSAGGIIKALPLLGNKPFFVLNSDTFWLEQPSGVNFRRLAENFKPESQDMLMLTLPRDKALTPQKGDLLACAHSSGGEALIRADKAADNPQAVIYAGGLIINPAIFKFPQRQSAETEPQSLNMYFDRAIAAGRLFGQNLEGQWISIGSPAELAAAEAALERQA